MTANEPLLSFCHTSSDVTRELAFSIALDAIGLSGRIAIAIGRHLQVEAAPNWTGGVESTGPRTIAVRHSITARLGGLWGRKSIGTQRRSLKIGNDQPPSMLLLVLNACLRLLIDLALAHPSVTAPLIRPSYW